MSTVYTQSDKLLGYDKVAQLEYALPVHFPTYGEYAINLYRGTIAVSDIPEEYSEAVQTIVEMLITCYGKYEDPIVSSFELRILAEHLPNCKLTRAEAKTLFADIEKLRTGASDAVASTAVSAYPKLAKDGALVKAGTRINWNGVLKRAAADLWDTAENNPDNAPDLWENINYRDGYRIIPDVITTGLAFGLDEYGWWGDTLYRSKLTANVYTPEQYPAGWETVIE